MRVPGDPGARRRQKESGSFLKKRTKKLLSIGARAGRLARAQADEVFFASFFFRKKKTLA
jgi:hypothetical protein